MGLLKVGSTGPDVRHVQVMLNRLIPAPPLLVVDGIFGPKTRERVVQFQSKNGLDADGIVGPLTSKALVEAVLRAVILRV